MELQKTSKGGGVMTASNDRDEYSQTRELPLDKITSWRKRMVEMDRRRNALKQRYSDDFDSDDSLDFLKSSVRIKRSSY